MKSKKKPVIDLKLVNLDIKTRLVMAIRLLFTGGLWMTFDREDFYKKLYETK